jgi:hypothetical protein
MPVYWDLATIERRLAVWEEKVVELERTGVHPQQLEHARQQVICYKAARLEALFGEVDITKYIC